ncbi:MAG TPA: GFA family protein [Rhodanobacteraceae bacterium]
MMHQGSCHCGRVAFEVEGEPTQLIECNCSHCDRKGYLLWFVTADKFHLLQGEGELTNYQFNKHEIDHKFCSTCGCAPFATGKVPVTGVEMVAVNVRCMPELDRAGLDVKQVDGRSL